MRLPSHRPIPPADIHFSPRFLILFALTIITILII